MGQRNDLSDNPFELLRQARAYRVDKDYYETRPEDRAKALTLLHRALDLCQSPATLSLSPQSPTAEDKSPQDLQLEAWCLQDISRIHDMNGDYPTARVWAKLTLAAFQKLGDLKEEAWAFQKLANLHYVMNDYGNALEYARRALRLAERLKNFDYIANANSILGVCYNELGRDDEAQIAFRKCLDACRSGSEDAHTLAYLVNALDYFCDANHPEQAQELCDHLAALIPGSKARQKVIAYLTLANACNMLNCFHEAIGYCLDGIALCQEISDQYSEASLFSALGSARRSLGDAEAARDAYLRVIAFHDILGNSNVYSHAHLALSELYEADGNVALAYVHFKQHHAIDKVLFNEEAAGKIRAVTVEMQLDRAKQEAEIHRIRSVELTELNAALESANERLQEQNEALEAQAAALQSYAVALEEQGKLLRAQARDMERLSTVDALTGVYNRRYLEDWMTRAFVQARRYPSELTVALADIDHFKSINDNFGHRVGDEVLKALGKIFTDSCRAGDLVARYGGEEFVFAMTHTSHDAARAACERVRQAVEGYRWNEIHPDLKVTISIGVSSETTLTTYDRIFGDADAHLYEAKRNGRNLVA